MIKLRHILAFVALGSILLLLTGCDAALLDPKGIIALREKRLLIAAVLLMLLIVIPVMILTVIVARKYRASNTQAKYTPEWSHSTLLEIIWWTIPCIIIVILATITWISSHRLDPYRPLEVTDKKAVTIQVVALDWKWLFIYPEQQIASVNFMQVPVDTPVNFLITADAPMNSFAIPQLAGQIYAMPGMQTKLHIMANEAGDYSGMSANYSGDGFTDMRFIVRAGSEEEFQQWVTSAKASSQSLNMATYGQLAQKSQNNKVEYFSSVEDNLFSNIIMKYMMPMHGTMQSSHDSMATATTE